MNPPTRPPLALLPHQQTDAMSPADSHRIPTHRDAVDRLHILVLPPPKLLRFLNENVTISLITVIMNEQ